MCLGGAEEAPGRPQRSRAWATGPLNRAVASQEWWEANRPGNYTYWKINFTRKPPPELRLLRKALALLLAERTGHGDYRSYHERFKHDPETWKPCACGLHKEPGHVFKCPLNSRALPADGKGSPLRYMWRNKKMLALFKEFWSKLAPGRKYRGTLGEENIPQIEEEEA